MKLTKVFLIAVIIKVLFSTVVIIGTWCLAADSIFSKNSHFLSKEVIHTDYQPSMTQKCSVLSDIDRVKADLRYILGKTYIASYDKAILNEDIKRLENYYNTQD